MDITDQAARWHREGYLQALWDFRQGCQRTLYSEMRNDCGAQASRERKDAYSCAYLDACSDLGCGDGILILGHRWHLHTQQDGVKVAYRLDMPEYSEKLLGHALDVVGYVEAAIEDYEERFFS